jgi:hypothetical protein
MGVIMTDAAERPSSRVSRPLVIAAAAFAASTAFGSVVLLVVARQLGDPGIFGGRPARSSGSSSDEGKGSWDDRLRGLRPF